MKQLKINKYHFKRCLSIILLFLSTVSCVSKAKFTKCKYHSIEIQANLLKKYYQQVITNTGKKRAKYEQLFFEVFPSSFVNFLRLYGYGYQDQPALLYDEIFKEDGYGHIQLFNDLKCINKEAYYNKYIDIYVGGWWEGDAISSFGLGIKLLQDTEECANVLSKRSKEELLSVFLFMFDEPHSECEEAQASYKNLYEKVVKVNPQLAKLMEAAHYRLLCYASCLKD